MNILNIPYDRGVRIVKHEEIVRIQSLSNYSKIFFTAGNPMVVAKVLHWFEESLPQEMFARIHRSHLVNRTFIKNISGEGYRSLLLSNGEIITMSKRKKCALKVSLNHC